MTKLSKRPCHFPAQIFFISYTATLKLLIMFYRKKKKKNESFASKKKVMYDRESCLVITEYAEKEIAVVESMVGGKREKIYITRHQVNQTPLRLNYSGRLCLTVKAFNNRDTLAYVRGLSQTTFRVLSH